MPSAQREFLDEQKNLINQDTDDKDINQRAQVNLSKLKNSKGFMD
jgi:hypothetical protein